jgi:hypothetical protein
MVFQSQLVSQILAELTDDEMKQIRETLEKLKKFYLENKWTEDDCPVDSKYGFRIGHLNCKQRLWLATNGYKVYNYWDNYSGTNVITLCLYK